MLRFRRSRTEQHRSSERAVIPGFCIGVDDRRTGLSLSERATLAREHGAADIVTSFGMVLSLR